MLIYVNITDRRTNRQTYQKYSSEPHNIFSLFQLFYRIETMYYLLYYIMTLSLIKKPYPIIFFILTFYHTIEDLIIYPKIVFF